MIGTQARRAELTERLHEVQERITVACRASDRSSRPTLIVVTKFFPVEDLVMLADAGVRDMGENREQELLAKAEYLRQERPDLASAVRLHFIGQLQSKKAKRVGLHADAVHSLDRVKLVSPLAAAAAERGRALDVLLQVSLDQGADGRGGVAPGALAALADTVEREPHLQLKGLMAVAPLGEAPEAAFERLGRIRERFVSEHPDADWLSAGMTSDLEAAVAIGATHLRVGSAILGSRPAAR